MDTQIAAKTAPTGKVQTMVETALLIAVTLIMGLTPLGTIRTPILSVSLVTVPVAIAAMLIGPMGAFACGTVFGITSFINALTGASGLLSALLQVSPLGVFVTAIIARMLDGKKTYGEIETATKASAATISRVNKCLQYGAGGYTRVLKRMQEQEANDEQ